jgi:hypothetical protein
MRKIYEKNRPLLDDLPETDRVMVEKRLLSNFAQLARQAAWEEIETGNRGLALRYWWESLEYNPKSLDPRWLARLLLPAQLYSGLRAVYHKFCDGLRYE